MWPCCTKNAHIPLTYRHDSSCKEKIASLACNCSPPSDPLLKKLNTLLIYATNTLKSCISVYKHIHLPHLPPKLFHPPFSRTTQCCLFHLPTQMPYFSSSCSKDIHVSNSFQVQAEGPPGNSRLPAVPSSRIIFVESCFRPINTCSPIQIHSTFTHNIYIFWNLVAFKR